MNKFYRVNNYENVLTAQINGSSIYPKIHGIAKFKQMNNGVFVSVEVFNLPYEECKNEIYGFHIHEGDSCTGNDQDPFSDAGAHYNKNECEHPYHSGDMPPLFGNKGYAYMSFFTNRFTLDDIINKTVIIHKNADDLSTSPSGMSGEKIACGIIKK